MCIHRVTASQFVCVCQKMYDDSNIRINNSGPCFCYRLHREDVESDPYTLVYSFQSCLWGTPSPVTCPVQSPAPGHVQERGYPWPLVPCPFLGEGVLVPQLGPRIWVLPFPQPGPEQGYSFPSQDQGQDTPPPKAGPGQGISPGQDQDRVNPLSPGTCHGQDMERAAHRLRFHAEGLVFLIFKCIPSMRSHWH